ncbi:UNVERIFIED_CONTAM: hypothetical protein FKN15_021144 [Acipenser sinensis]
MAQGAESLLCLLLALSLRCILKKAPYHINWICGGPVPPNSTAQFKIACNTNDKNTQHVWSSISRMSSKEKISLHDKERRALETLEPVAFEGVEEERKGEGDSSFGRKAEDSGTTPTSSALSRLNALTAQRLARQVEDKDSVSTTTTTSSSSSSSTTAATQGEAKERRRSYLTPVRDEEAEAQRKARSRHARQSRRSTQGVTLTDLQEAEKTMKGQQETRATEQREEERKREEEEKERVEALSKHRASRTGEEGVSGGEERAETLD